MVQFYICSYCEKNMAKHLCGRCYHKQYCSRECQIANYDYHKIECFPIPKGLGSNKNNILLRKALEFNLLWEYHGGATKFDHLQIYDRGRNLVYKGLIGMILFNPVSGTKTPNMTAEELTKWEAFEADIEKGIRLILAESPNSMKDPLLWCFIPKKLHPCVQEIYDRI